MVYLLTYAQTEAILRIDTGRTSTEIERMKTEIKNIAGEMSA